MGTPNFPKLRGADGEASRVQDNIDSTLRPMVLALANTPIMGAASPNWIRPDLVGGWANIGTIAGINYAIAAFHKDALGYVHMKGLISNAAGVAAGVTMLTLPMGYRPREYNRFVVDFNGGASNTVMVAPTGALWTEAVVAAGNNISLSIIFLAEQ